MNFIINFEIFTIPLHFIHIHIITVLFWLYGLPTSNEPIDLVNIFIPNINRFFLIKWTKGKIFFISFWWQSDPLVFVWIGKVLYFFFNEVPHWKIVGTFMLLFVVFDKLFYPHFVVIFVLFLSDNGIELLGIDLEIEQQILIDLFLLYENTTPSIFKSRSFYLLPFHQILEVFCLPQFRRPPFSLGGKHLRVFHDLLQLYTYSWAPIFSLFSALYWFHRFFAHLLPNADILFADFFHRAQWGMILLADMFLRLDVMDVVFGFHFTKDGVHVYFVSFVAEFAASGGS